MSMAILQPSTSPICPQCGAPKTKGTTICLACQCAQRKAERIVRQTRICTHCGTSFVKSRDGKTKGLYCKRECAFADPKWNDARNQRNLQRVGLSPEVKQQRLEAKAFARAERRRALEHQKAETHARQRAEYNQMKAERYAQRLARPPRPCPACGTLFVPVQGKRKYCSDDCTRRTLKRIDKGIRRARLRNSPSEAVDPMVVLARDGWRCQLCGRKTPKRYRATNRLDAPELDHIIPLSLGGSHTYVNTQCACRGCNMKKGARIKGQLRLCV